MEIKKFSEIRLDWYDFPHNFSKEGEKNIRVQFANKYNVDLKQIKVLQIPIKLNSKGERIIWTDGLVENVLNIENQRNLMLKWLKNENIVNYDWERLIEIDNKVNSEINYSVNDINCGVTWNPIKLHIENLLSFEKIDLNFNDYQGVVLVTSDPPNMGGKTNLTVDSIMFVCYGVTTKTDKNEDLFNLYLNKNELNGYLIFEVNGVKYKIDRTLKRKEKKDGTWSVTNKVSYYKIIDDSTEVELLDDDENVNQEGEQARETNKIIRDIIGLKEDFETIICATSDTLTNLINPKVIGATDRGKLLNKFIGIDIFEKKEKVIRLMRSSFEKTMKCNIFNSGTLAIEIDNLKNRNIDIKNLITENKQNVIHLESEIKELNDTKDRLYSSKSTIDDNILSIDETSINRIINQTITSGLEKTNKKKLLLADLDNLKDLTFNEVDYNKIINLDKEYSIEISNLNNEVKRLENENIILEKNSTCPTCHRPLEGVDNKPQITNNNKKIIELQNRLKLLKDELLPNNTKKLNEINIIRNKITERDRVELNISKIDVDLLNLRETLKHNKQLLKEFEQNKENIEKNNNLDIEINNIKSKLSNKENNKQRLLTEIEQLFSEEKQNIEKIIDKTDLIKDIEIEQDKLKYLNLYLSIVESKRGVGKIVLKDSLPIINHTINEILDDEVCDFDVELILNNSNELEILMKRDEIYSKIKGASGFESFAVSLALRVVFSRLSTLPKPNFMIFDEILGGKVAAENLDKVQLVFEKIKKYYNTIFFITHDERTKDWCDKTITIKKKDNISYIN